jgi:hypothetical protein
MGLELEMGRLDWFGGSGLVDFGVSLCSLPRFWRGRLMFESDALLLGVFGVRSSG